MNLLGHTGEELPDSEKMFLIHNPQTESEAEKNVNLNQEENDKNHN